MDMLLCPGCACHLCDGRGVCPVCEAPRGEAGVALPLRNPFKLIALCVVHALAIWVGALFLLGLGAGGEQLAESLGGSLLLASIGLSIVLTVRGKLPGTAHIKPPGP